MDFEGSMNIVDLLLNDMSASMDFDEKVGWDVANDNFLESLLQMEEHSEPLDLLPIDVEDFISSAATIPMYDNAKISSCSDSGLSSVDHFPFIPKSESSMSEPSDDAATQMDFSNDSFVREKIIEDDEDVQMNINDVDKHSLEKPTVIKHPQLLKTTPPTVLISSPNKSNRHISISKYLSSNQVCIPINVSNFKTIKVVNQNGKFINADAFRRLQSMNSGKRICLRNNDTMVSNHMLMLKHNKVTSYSTSDESNAMYPHICLTNEEKKLMEKGGSKLPLRYPLTKRQEWDLKQIRRKIRRNLSSQNSRKRKKEYVDGLEKRVKQYTDENNQLKKTVSALQAENKRFKAALKYLQNATDPEDKAHPTTCLSPMLLALISTPNLRPSISDEKDVMTSIDGQGSNLHVTGQTQNLSYCKSELPLSSITSKDVLNNVANASSDGQGNTIMAKLGELLNFNGLICNEDPNYTRSIKKDYFITESDDGLTKATKCSVSSEWVDELLTTIVKKQL